jgi:acetyl-CoA carboxylase biotin carboxyl carrier protein
MVRPGYPFRDRDPNRRDDMAGNRRDDMAGNRRDDMVGNRREDATSNRRDDQAGSRRDQQQRPDRRPRPEAAPSSTDLSSLTADIEALLRLVNGTDVTELQIERGDLKVLIRRGAAPAHPVSTVQPLPLGGLHPAQGALVAGEARGGGAPPAPPDRPAPASPGAPPAPAGPILGEREHLLTAPMVGTFYSAPSPKDTPFVTEGDVVEAGQTIGIIEAMKIMNEIEAEVAGRVKRILARDGQGVEYGQPLLVIEEV